MLYAAMTFWLLVAVAAAWGVQQLWTGMVRPRVFNVVLLPGTLAAQLGHILGLLLTGGKVTNTSLISDDETGNPETTSDAKPRIPVVGPIVIGLLPLVACAAGIYFAAWYLGRPMAERVTSDVVGPSLPLTVAGCWDLLRGLVTVSENTVNAVLESNLGSWRTWLFLYLLTCLSVRMAPLPGNVRGSIGAILILGVVGALAASLFDVPDPRLQTGWAIIRLTVGTLLALLIISSLIRGTVAVVQAIRGGR